MILLKSFCFAESSRIELNHKEKQRGCPLLDANKYTLIYWYTSSSLQIELFTNQLIHFINQIEHLNVKSKIAHDYHLLLEE